MRAMKLSASNTGAFSPLREIVTPWIGIWSKRWWLLLLLFFFFNHECSHSCSSTPLVRNDNAVILLTAWTAFIFFQFKMLTSFFHWFVQLFIVVIFPYSIKRVIHYHTVPVLDFFLLKLKFNLSCYLFTSYRSPLATYPSVEHPAHIGTRYYCIYSNYSCSGKAY